jgi:uncharacterized membrane protein
VVIVDWVFTAATAVFQPLGGFWMLHLAGLSQAAIAATAIHNAL